MNMYTMRTYDVSVYIYIYIVVHITLQLRQYTNIHNYITTDQNEPNYLDKQYKQTPSTIHATYIHTYVYIYIFIYVYYMCMLSADNNSGDGTPSSRGRLQTPDM